MDLKPLIRWLCLIVVGSLLVASSVQAGIFKIKNGSKYPLIFTDFSGTMLPNQVSAPSDPYQQTSVTWGYENFAGTALPATFYIQYVVPNKNGNGAGDLKVYTCSLQKPLKGTAYMLIENKLNTASDLVFSATQQKPKLIADIYSCKLRSN